MSISEVSIHLIIMADMTHLIPSTGSFEME